MQNLNLEVSLKPFFGLDGPALRAACDDALRQWAPLIARTDSVSVMFWASDGSEILDYGGDLDAEFEWARFIGNANSHVHPAIPSDPEGKSLHARPYLYRDDARPITYRRLAEISLAWREVISALGKTARVGLTFDPGGEFAPSSFKYERHREICLADTMGKGSFVCCYGILNSDTHRYAGFRDGIPQGTSLGAFLGRQFHHLARDVGLDFLWLSNGFGFGMETWKTVGPLFDGETFHPADAPALRDRILRFWRDFRHECPGLGIMTRGTNLGTATDLASDATPLREIYEGGFDMDPPPNSPWAALNGDFGLELAGYMGRVVELPPGKAPLFRFYIHDPWWLNSPWLDRHERQPHDIYLPLSVARVTASGETEPAQNVSFLSIDDSYGRMPEIVPREVNPHMLRAWDERPDAPGPLVWLYPFDELHDAMFGPAPTPERLFHVDWFAREILNNGVPLNTVVSTRSWRALGERVRAVFSGRVIVTPAPFDAAGERLLLDWVEAGGDLLVYGPLDTAPRLRERLGLEAAAPLDGLVEVSSAHPPLDRFETAERPRTFHHRTCMSGGALAEKSLGSGPSAPSSETTARLGDETRALSAAFSTPASGRVRWLRGPLPLRFRKDLPIDQQHLPLPDDRTTTFSFGELVRQTLSDFGWRIALRAFTRDQRLPVLTLHRRANGWFFSAYLPDTTVEISLGAPFGAPLLLGYETHLRDGASSYRLPRASRLECRVFVEQADGWLKHIEELPGQIGVTRRLWIHGLKDAVVRFFPPAGSGPTTLWLNPQWPFIGGNSVPLLAVASPHGPMLETTHRVSGTALLSW